MSILLKPTPLFIATERFDPSDGVGWEKYCEFAKIPGLKEIISLDSPLCPCLIKEPKDEDWAWIVNENFGRTYYFSDLDYLLSRVVGVRRRNILGVYRNPDEATLTPPAPKAFSFIGYDLVDEETQISALTNCGGFPEVFMNSELNCFGLLQHFERARDVRAQLARLYPEGAHTECELYAIWRLNEPQ